MASEDWKRRFRKGFVGKDMGIKKEKKGQDQSRESKERRRKSREAKKRRGDW